MAYRIEVSDTADAEAEEAYLWLLRLSPELAVRWYQVLLDASETLSDVPRRFIVAAENDVFPDVEVRQLLYVSGRNVYRILFCILEPDTVRILHVRHASRRRLGEPPLQEGDE